MPKVLLTGMLQALFAIAINSDANIRPGGSGFIAAHIVDILLQHGYALIIHSLAV